MRTSTIAVLPGDGIGPEVTRAAVRVLRRALEAVDVRLETVEAAIGGAAIDAVGEPLPAATLAACRGAAAALLGAVGGPAWDHVRGADRPEAGLLRIRKELGLWANVRPVRPRPALFGRAPLRADLLDGVDLVFVRELTSGIYFGDKLEGDQRAHDVCAYTREEIERVVRRAATMARARSGRLTSVDKANVMATSRLWRATAERVVREEFADVTLEHVLVDAMAMHLVQQPARFDVVVTENLFGDVLSDEASVLAGSLGMLPSASLGVGGFGLYEPVHGSAPDLAGQDVANPCGAIESAAMLARHSLDQPEVAAAIERAVDVALADGWRTRDLAEDGAASTSCSGFAEAVCDALDVTAHEAPGID
jgi:3-isopropylmalate dehydrogenase